MLSPRVIGEKVYFLSDMGGVLSLYSMSKKGGIPQPLLPGGLALVNPHLMNGNNFVVLPNLGKIMVMIDKNGDENYQPSFIPMDGGFPEPIFGKDYENEQISCIQCDHENNVAFFERDNRKRPELESLHANLQSKEVTSLGRSPYGNYPTGVSSDNSKVILADGYTAGDVVLFFWQKGMTERSLLHGTPIEKREEKPVPPSGIGRCNFVDKDKAILFRSTIFHDTGAVTYLALDSPSQPVDVPVEGLRHSGTGELNDVRQVKQDLFVLDYNIDGASWIYEARYVAGVKPSFKVLRVLVGSGALSNGVALGIEWEVKTDAPVKAEYVLSFTKANMPSQLYLYPADGREGPVQLTEERVLGIPDGYLSAGGEDASYTTFDGQRVSARLYLPSSQLGFRGPYPLVEYVHGGPQGQERPDFTWFSMPLIQYLTLNGFAVFVPNVRGSTGYGIGYMKEVDRDWGGDDVKDHLEGLKRLEKDPRIDSSRRGVVGRSYGGYMTLTLAVRHPSLWKAAVDMFGPYDLPAWLQRLPPSWLTYMRLAVGDPDKDQALLVERSPKTYFDNLSAPLMIIQGKNDPRVPEPESAQVAADLRQKGVNVDYLVFEDEGHDVLRFKNRAECYNKITEFFRKNLGQQPA